jgi:hypothetical protein
MTTDLRPLERPVSAIQPRSAIAVAAIVCAIAAFLVGPVLGFFLAVAAVLLGALGILRATSPRVRGAFMSVAAILLGLAGVVVKIVQGVLGLLF